MQEQNSEKVVSLSVRATKITANLFKSAINEYLKHQKNRQPKVYKGKQSMKHLMLADFLNIEHNITTSLHLQSIDQNKAIKTVKRKITDLDKMTMEEQKKVFRNGYDIDIMPSDINTFGKEAKSLLNDLQSRNERLFMVTILIMNTAETKRKLDNILFQEAGIAQKYNCQLKRLDYQQEDGIMACVPIGVNEIEIRRGLTTSSNSDCCCNKEKEQRKIYYRRRFYAVGGNLMKGRMKMRKLNKLI